MPGQDLAKMIEFEKLSGLQEKDKIIITYKCMLEVMRMHALGWIHCDIKPNQFLCYYDNHNWYIYLVDFGSAVRIEDAVKQPVPDYLGTAPYIAREVYRNYDKPVNQREFYDQRVDVYALGITIAEIILGKFCVNWICCHRRFLSLLPKSVRDIVSSMVEFESTRRCSLKWAQSEMQKVVCTL